MKYYQLDPEVAGGWGEGTRADTTVHPPLVTKLHYAFDGWLGDKLLQTFPCFIVAEDLATALRATPLTGFTLGEVQISRTQQFIDLHPDVDLPKFYWLQVGHGAGSDDFGLSPRHSLVVSETALQVLRSHGIEHCDVKPYA